MVSFSCEACGDVLTKKKLDGHRNICRGASYTCLDCMVHFQGLEYRTHTSCISEAQKYQGHLYREKETKKSKIDKRKSVDKATHHASVQDAVDGDDMNAVAVIDVPPRAPTPPPIIKPGALPDVNVWDYMDPPSTGKGRGLPQQNEGRKLLAQSSFAENGDSQLSQYSQFSNGDGTQFREHGFSYGNAPVPPGLQKYESWNENGHSQQSQTSMLPPYTTPAPKNSKKHGLLGEKSDKKRKREYVEDPGLSSTKRPVSRDEAMLDVPGLNSNGRVLHSGLTGGLSRLVTDPDHYEEHVATAPATVSPLKRSKRSAQSKDSRDDRRTVSHGSHASSKAASSSHASEAKSQRSRRHESVSSNDDDNSRSGRAPRSSRTVSRSDRQGSAQPTATNQLVAYNSRADMFLSFITKGPESERGLSINKALKRYHRECETRSDERDDDDKELWKSLRLRRNSRGEIVLFV